MIETGVDSLTGGEMEGGDQRFQLLLDTLPHIAFAIFSAGRAEYYNKAFLNYHGFVPGRDQQARTALLHPEDRPALEAELRGAWPR